MLLAKNRFDIIYAQVAASIIFSTFSQAFLKKFSSGTANNHNRFTSNNKTIHAVIIGAAPQYRR